MAFWKKKKPAVEAKASPAQTPASVPSQPESAPVKRQISITPPQSVPPSQARRAPPQASQPPNSEQSGGAPPASSASTTGRSTGAAKSFLTAPVAESLGKVVSILMFSRRFQGMTLRELSNIILPPVMANQYIVAQVKAQERDVTIPVGLLLWAQLSDELDQKLIAENGSEALLSGNEWKSGNNLWIIETVGQQKIVKAMVRQLMEGAFKGRPFKFRTRSADGTASIEEFDPASVSGPQP